MAHYIRSNQVTDAALAPLVTEAYLDNVDSDIELLARRRGVPVEDVEIDPLDPILVDLAAAYCCKRICLDKAGINPQAYANGVEVDIYAMKLSQYRKEIDRMEAMVTAEVLTGEADEPQEFANSIELYRG